MAVAYLFEVKGVSADQYEAVMQGIGRERLDSPQPEGIISHIAGPTSSGWRVIDVWEDEEHAGRFYGGDQFQQAVAANLPPVQPDGWSLHRIEVWKTASAAH